MHPHLVLDVAYIVMVLIGILNPSLILQLMWNMCCDGVVLDLQLQICISSSCCTWCGMCVVGVLYWTFHHSIASHPLPLDVVWVLCWCYIWHSITVLYVILNVVFDVVLWWCWIGHPITGLVCIKKYVSARPPLYQLHQSFLSTDDKSRVHQFWNVL